jgi:hypothetical protein
MNKFFLLIGLLGFSYVVNAQSVKITEPEFSGNIVYVNDNIGEGLPLEVQRISLQAKTNGAEWIPVVGIFASKTKSKNRVHGCCSTLKIPKNSNIKFVIKVSDNSEDPTTFIKIFKLKSTKDNREIETSSGNIVGGITVGNINYTLFKAKKYGVSSYLIEIESADPGEYAITLESRPDIFNLFSI